MLVGIGGLLDLDIRLVALLRKGSCSGERQHHEQRARNHPHPPALFIAVGTGREGHAQNQSGQKSANVRRIVNAAGRGSERKIVENEERNAGEVSFQQCAELLIAVQQHRRNQRSGYPEDGSRRADTHAVPVPANAAQAAANAAQQIKQGEARATEEQLRQPSQAVEAPHIERDVQQSAMLKGGCEQSPPLPAGGQHSGVRAPVQQKFRIEGEEAAGLPRHDQIDQRVQRDQNDGRRLGELLQSARCCLGRFRSVPPSIADRALRCRR